MKVKICGLSRTEDIECVNRLKPDFIGFVFAESKRKVTAVQAYKLKKYLQNYIKAVGVFVNEDIEFIAKLAHEKIIDCIQLHGNETIEYCRSIKTITKLPVIKAIRVNNRQSLENINSYPCDYFLFDTYVKGQYGGSGKTFDISLLEEAGIKKPYFIAGGLNADNLEKVKALQPFGIDVSGGVETDGIKDAVKIEKFIKEISPAVICQDKKQC